MSRTIPASLKAADIARFAHRAGQLEKARPAVAYWCNYWIVEQIISKGLHQADDESKTYTMQVMDNLEQMKVDFAENDTITDDVAGHAYIEQFGHETFQRADNAMKANKVTRQTADTFQASATFLELCQIWGPVDSEIASKIKFAKYHALRIAKAIKAGEDPNLSNPKPEPPPDEIEVNEAGPEQSPEPQPGEVKATGSYRDEPGEAEDWTHIRSKQPFVEDDNGGGESPMPGRAQPFNLQTENYYQQAPQPDVSPLAPSSEGNKSPQHNSYFPEIPPSPMNPPGTEAFSSQPDPNDTEIAPTEQTPSVPQGFPDIRAGSIPPSLGTEPTVPTGPTLQPPPIHSNINPSHGIPTRSNMPDVQPTIPQPRSAAPVTLKDDEASVSAAQKHAKFAISALNFEDVPTAVQELRSALESLGAR